MLSGGDFDTVVNATIDLLFDDDYMLVNSSTGEVFGNFQFVGNSSLVKRADSSCTWYHYDSYQVARGGDWWSPWYPISCCVYNGLGNGAHYTLGYEWEYGWSIDGNSGIGFEAAQRVIQASLGFSVSKSYHKKDEMTCDLQDKSVVQIWYQQHMVWADIQKRDCCYTVSGPNKCGAWGPYKRANSPIKDSYSLGCSVGLNNVDCGRKGLRCAYHH